MSKTKQAEARDDERYDVIIYNIKTGLIDTMAGENLPTHSSFHTADKRLMTALSRINEHYDAQIVPTGKYKVGDKFGGVK